MKNKYFIGIIVLFLVVGFIFLSGNSERIDISEKYGIASVTIFKSPTCGCCDLYSAYLRKYGVDVDVKNVEDMDKIKDEYGVPSSIASCHTSLIGDEVVEGHVPVESIFAVLEDDSVSNIGLPGMPSGSPGMPGPKPSPFTIYSFDGGEINEFMKI